MIPIPDFQPVASSQIDAVAYTPETKQLFIVFKPKGSVYRYFDVPEAEFEAFKAAKSIGTFFGERIKGKDKANPLYKFERVATGKEEFEAWWERQQAPPVAGTAPLLYEVPVAGEARAE
jgi:hypothetical protein